MPAILHRLAAWLKSLLPAERRRRRAAEDFICDHWDNGE